MAKGQKLSKTELSSLVDSEVANAMGSTTSAGDLSKQRSQAMDYYLGRPLGNEQDGRSKVIIHDVAEVIENMLPSLLRIFTTSENVISFVPVGPEDVEAAAQETDAVNHVYWKENDGFMFTYTWLKDALLQKNGIVMATWDDSEIVTRETYKGLTNEELIVMINDPELELVESEEHEGVIASGIQEENGAPVATEAGIGMVYDAIFERTTKRGQVKLENVPPEEFMISSECRTVNPSDARFVGRRMQKTRQELIADGFDEDVILGLSKSPRLVDRSEEGISRRFLSDETDENTATDKLVEIVDIIEAYIRVDYDGDGHAELRQVIKAGSTIISNEEVDRQPFHAWTPFPLPHKFFGLSLADQTMDIQLVRTTLVRQMLDNLYLANQPRKVIWEDAIGDTTMDDLLSSRVGGVIRVTRPVNDSIREEDTPFVAQQAFPMLSFYDQRIEQRTGVGQGVQGLDTDSLKNVQTTALAQMSDMSSMMIENIARVFSETGMKTLMLHIHELMQKNASKSQYFRLRNKYVIMVPSEWRTRHNLTVTVGLGNGTREQKLIHLQAIRDVQAQIAQGGGMGTLISPENIYNTAKEFAKNALFKDPDMFFTDPSTLPPEAFDPPPDTAAAAQEQFIQMTSQIEQGKIQLETQKAAMQAQKDQSNLQMQGIKTQLAAEKAGAELQIKQAKVAIDKQNADTESQKAIQDLLVKMEDLTRQYTELELRYQVNIPGEGADDQ